MHIIQANTASCCPSRCSGCTVGSCHHHHDCGNGGCLGRSIDNDGHRYRPDGCGYARSTCISSAFHDQSCGCTDHAAYHRRSFCNDCDNNCGCNNIRDRRPSCNDRDNGCGCNNDRRPSGNNCDNDCGYNNDRRPSCNDCDNGCGCNNDRRPSCNNCDNDCGCNNDRDRRPSGNDCNNGGGYSHCRQTPGMVYHVEHGTDWLFHWKEALENGTLFQALHKPMNGGCEVTTCATEAQAIAFAMWELRLYLNTHPDDCEALALFRQLEEKSCDPNYASTFATDDGHSEGWNWVNNPWPWERTCCNDGCNNN